MATTDIKTLFGNRVRELRRLRGLTQEGFAQQVGLDRSYMGGVERGERNISIENIALIAEGLEVSLSALFEFPGGRGAAARPTGKIVSVEGGAGEDRT